MKLYLLGAVALGSLVLAGCASTPTASNYGHYMNDPTVQHGASADINSQLANKKAWNNIKVTQMSSVRRLANGGYAPEPGMGTLNVRAVLVNTGNAPAQGNWRCRFFDSNNIPLYEQASDQPATSAEGIGWHQMVVYPLTSNAQVADANVIRCKAPTSEAVTSRVEFHDTSNDVTVYQR